MLEIDKLVNDLVEQKFSLIENFLSDDLLNSLHDEIVEINRNDNLKTAGVGRKEDHTLAKAIRKDKIK